MWIASGSTSTRPEGCHCVTRLSHLRSVKTVFQTPHLDGSLLFGAAFQRDNHNRIVQTIAWILLAVTSLLRIFGKEGIVFGFLFFVSAAVGFVAFGVLKGLGYLSLLFVCSVIARLIETFLSMGTAAKLARPDIEKNRNLAVSSLSQVMESAMASSAALPIGNYRLDRSTAGLTGLTEFTAAEYLAFGRNFDGEKNFHAPGVDLLNRQWKVALGTVYGKVYKIALYFESESKTTAIDVSRDLMRFCGQHLGKPSEQNKTLYVWEKPDGNVVVQFGKVGTTYLINLFETSRSVRNFSPRR